MMAAPAPEPRRPIEVVDLTSSDEDEDDDTDSTLPSVPGPDPEIDLDSDADMDMDSDPESDAESVRARSPRTQDAPPPHSDNPSDRLADQYATYGGTIVRVGGEEIFIPDEENFDYHSDVPADANMAMDREIALALDNDQGAAGQVVTVDDCLARVLEIFPDISHDYVHSLYNEFDHEGDYEILPGAARLDNIIEQLVSAPHYPKQEKGKKRKREESVSKDPDHRWVEKDRVQIPAYLKGSMQAMLKVEFPEIPVQYINDTLAAEKHLFPAFVLLARIRDTSDQTSRPYGKGRPSSKHLADAATIAANCGWPDLLEELNAARRRVAAMRNDRAAEHAKKREEQENLQRAIASGETAECSACYDDLPMNRQMHCNGSVAHFTCFECMETYVKSEVGESRCRVLCPAGCGAGFAHNQLHLLTDKILLAKLAQLQQEKDIRDAGMADLEECPFCDYKAIMPPVEEDFEFRCANSECEKISCRRCKSISHVPISCEQHAKDNKINSRHKIEEAMTAALVRSCNKCKKQFIKEYGCNKMTCPSCGNLQCYVCSATLKDYNHFDQNYLGRANNGPAAAPAAGSSKKSCPLYDNVEERHEREVREAEALARAQVVEENPDVTTEDLEIRVSDVVKKATADRIRQAGGPAGAAYFAVPPAPPPAPHLFGPAFGVFDAAPPPYNPYGNAVQDPNAMRAGNFVAERPEEIQRRMNEERNELFDRMRMRAARDARRRRNNGLPANPEVIVGAMAPPVQGYIPVLGYPGAPPAQPPPAQPMQPVAPRQLGNALNQPPNLFGPIDLPIQPRALRDDLFYDFDLLGVGDGGLGDMDRAAPQPNRMAQPNDHNLFDNTRDVNNVFGNMRPPAAAIPIPPIPHAPAQQQQQQQQQQQRQQQQGPQPFTPGVREQRQGFQNLEMLRQQHEAQLRQRDAARQRDQARDQARQQLHQFRELQRQQMQRQQTERQQMERQQIDQQFARFGQRLQNAQGRRN